MRSSLFAPLAGLLLLAACGSSSSSAADDEGRLDASFDGIYEVTSFTLNETSCDAEGPSVLAQEGARFAVLQTDPDLERMLALGCGSVDDCRTVAASSPFQSFGLQLRSRRADGALIGQDTTTGRFEASTQACVEAAIIDHLVTGEARGAIRMETRHRYADDLPATSAGQCSSEAVQASAEGKPCTYYRVVEARFVAPL